MGKEGNLLRSVLLVSGVIFFWAGTACFMVLLVAKFPSTRLTPPDLGSLATILFGASSIALIGFSLLLAVAALIQWQSLKNEVRREVELSQIAQEQIATAMQESRERVASLEESIERRMGILEERVKGVNREIQGRGVAIMGFMIGTVHSSPTVLIERDEDKDAVSEAIQLCQKGYDILKDLDGLGKYMALNNVVYFSCLLGDDSRRELLLEQGREIRDVGLKYDSIAYLLTFVRVVSKYGVDPGEIQQAYSIVEELLARRLSNMQRKEAAMLAASLEKKLGGFTGPAN
jgi:hypothetical protein